MIHKFGDELIYSRLVQSEQNYAPKFLQRFKLANCFKNISVQSTRLNQREIVLAGENEISIKANYGQLKTDNITVTGSRENVVYRALLNEWKRLRGKMTGLNIEKLRISTVDPFYTRKAKDIEGRVISIMQEHNVHLLYIKEAYADTFTAEVLVNLSLLPLLTDHPKLSGSYDNKRAFMHDYFFEFVDFDDERIIYTPFLAKKYFTYLDKYTQ